MVVMVLCAVTLLVLGSALRWTTTNNRLTHRQNQYFRSVAAAEAATEKVLSRLTSDYKRGGENLIMVNFDAITRSVPLSAENAQFGQYEFTDGQGNAGRTFVYSTAASQYAVLTAQYRGLSGYASSFRVISNARQLNTPFPVSGAVLQEFQVATIPLFQFAIFYNVDLEINPSPTMTITGPVHGNQDIYISPSSVLTFNNDITASGTINNNRMSLDPSTPATGGSIVFQAEHDGGTSSLNLPIGSDNSPQAVHKVIEAPPAGEAISSALGSQRIYNKADMIITVTGDTMANVTVTSGVGNNKSITVPAKQWDGTQATPPPVGGFLKQVTFLNKRENKTVKALEIDVGKLRLWSATSTNVLRPGLPLGDVTTIYVDDQRVNTSSSGNESGVRVVNGSVLPSKGLTVATADPIYVQGNYNTSDGLGHTSVGNTTAYTKPAALIGDAITVLSSAWSDANASQPISSRTAGDTTVNAALLGGIVPTTAANYSGGVENFTRFLENWSGKTLTYNGSMVVMFPSVTATAPWGGGDVYSPPARQWAFDQNFRDVTKQPPSTPMARGLIRGRWSTITPGTTVVANP